MTVTLIQSLDDLGLSFGTDKSSWGHDICDFMSTTSKRCGRARFASWKSELLEARRYVFGKSTFRRQK